MTIRRKAVISAACSFILSTLSGLAWSGVTAEEAARLKTTLTPLGGEKAGNKEGTIPAWTGGLTQAPAGYKNGAPRPDFFPDEKPVLVITGKNVDQYADKLGETTKALLKKHPDYRVDVYPTHRTAAAPQWVYDNTFKNATRATTSKGGEKMENAFGGVPFPIPKSGSEALWNARTAWSGEDSVVPATTWIVTAQGKRLMASKYETWFSYPYYTKDGNPEKFDGFYAKYKLLTQEPASKAGEGLLNWQAAESDKTDVWQYLVGQRRVRRSPSVAYDTPNFITSGIGFFDESFGLYGPTDRHEAKLIGKREMYVPYNANKAALATPEQLVGPKFLNPDLVRWELHRVWVVEATLREGKRHVVPKRVYYIDEDSWNILMIDGWDAKGELWRGQYVLPLLAPDVPALIGNIVNWGSYNVQTGEYYLSVATVGQPTQFRVETRRPDGFWTPESMANEGAR